MPNIQTIRHGTNTDAAERNEWYTPARHLDAVRRVLGSIKLDPASSETANHIVQADTYYDRYDDGLSLPWMAETLFLNPPYSNRLCQPFVEKFIEEHRIGNFDRGIILVNASTETQWFQSLMGAGFPCCLVARRIRFRRANGAVGDRPAHGNAFFYAGDDPALFRDVFLKHGQIVAQWYLPF